MLDIEKLCEEFQQKIGKDKTVKITIEDADGVKKFKAKPYIFDTTTPIPENEDYFRRVDFLKNLKTERVLEKAHKVIQDFAKEKGLEQVHVFTSVLPYFDYDLFTPNGYALCGSDRGGIATYLSDIN